MQWTCVREGLEGTKGALLSDVKACCFHFDTFGQVLEAGSQGKYFWLRLSDPGSHPVMHLGMNGWIHVHNDRSGYTNYYKKTKQEEQEAWPPRFWKFQLETEGKDPVRVAFTDSRR